MTRPAARPLGLSLTVSGLHRTLGPDPAHYVEIARIADEVGIDQFVLADHVLIGGHTDAYPYGEFPFEADEPWLEPLALLSAIAQATDRIRLATGILIAPLRPAPLLAKTVATLDALSGGRVDLGVGVGWQREEYDASGIPFERRWGRLVDTLEACRALWEQAPASHASPTVNFEGVWSRPAPAQSRIPVWFGANATEATARRIAAVGDGWMPLAASTPGEVRAGVDAITAAYAEAGRDPSGLLVRAGLPLARDQGQVDLAATMAGVAPLAAAGATTLAVNLRRMAEPADARPWLESLVEAWSTR